jgi:endonuclease YncB( thermonuclease family)
MTAPTDEQPFDDQERDDVPQAVSGALYDSVEEAPTRQETYREPARTEEQRYTAEQPRQAQDRRAEGFFERLAAHVASQAASETRQRPFNPNDYPAVYSSVYVLTADTLQLYGGKTFRLYGIDAPVSNQMCADNLGRSYPCGREAAAWLKGWIEDNELECHVLKQDTKGNMLGTCTYGPYDLGAALVNAGWAVANPQQTDVYTVYEQQAQKNRRGLWQGQFYKPRDWRKLQARKPKIKVLKPKERKMGIFG